jgi:hypothetical protein
MSTFVVGGPHGSQAFTDDVRFVEWLRQVANFNRQHGKCAVNEERRRRRSSGQGRDRLGVISAYGIGMRPSHHLTRRVVRLTGLAAVAGPVIVWRLGEIPDRSRSLSYRSWWSLMSASSLLSIASAASVLSIGSFASILSIGSSNSVLSIGSDGGFLSIGARRP